MAPGLVAGPHPTIKPEPAVCSAYLKKKPGANWHQALKDINPQQCSLTHQVVQWLAYRSDDKKYTFQEYANFVSAHEDWPWTFVLRDKAEAALDDSVPLDEIRQGLQQFRPRSLKGNLYMVKALFADNQEQKAIKLVRAMWTERNFDEAQEKDFLEKYQAHIRLGEHNKRTDRLVGDE